MFDRVRRRSFVSLYQGITNGKIRCSTGRNRYGLRREERIKVITATLYYHQWVREEKALSKLAGRSFTCECLIVGGKIV